jgi:hypothetical protein
MKVEYYPKNILQTYDNKIPGPGTCIYDVNVDQQKGIADVVNSYK